MKDKKSSEKKLTWYRIFSNNRFVAVFSLVAAFVIWVVLMNANMDETQTWRVDSVPITVEYSTGAVERGYKVYNTDRTAVNVSVSGNALSVRQVQAGDIEVVATITESLTPGSNTVNLIARKRSDSLNTFTIESVDPGAITAEIDVAREAVFDIESAVAVEAQENYYITSPELSATSVTVSGPESVLSRIESVKAEYEFTEPVSETKSFVAPIGLYDMFGDPVESEYLSLSVNSVDVRLPVYWKQAIALEATFTNKPTSFPNRLITLSPSTVEFAGAKESFDSLKSITLNPLDFSKINLSTTKFSANIITPDGLLNISDAQTVTISLDLTGYVERWVPVESIVLLNAPTDVALKVADENFSVLVIGPSATVSQLTEKNIYARINLSGQQLPESGEIQLPVVASVQDNTSCWVYGTYSATVTTAADTADDGAVSEPE